jgi:hypothetical protein
MRLWRGCAAADFSLVQQVLDREEAVRKAFPLVRHVLVC